ncbi:MAG: hypothetical protein PHH40_04985, partial [Candidatus Moranbacteria bacterium]|nr:hypothetical protein [Candidatus Moranbacteria bacterium]
YVLERSFSHGLGKNAWLDGVRNMVESTDAEQLAQYAKDRKAAQEESVARVGKIAEAIKDPKTLDDFKTWMRAIMAGGKTFKEARMMLAPEQRAKFDDLIATESRAERASRKESAQEAVLRAPGEAVTATEIIKTRHTKHGHDLWQFNLDQRVSGEEFKSLVAQAKRLGGDYSSYRGNGAIPGWQFRTEDAAKAFKSLIAGDTAAAKDVMQERRDAFADDSSQTAVQRLSEMADRLEEQADASLNQERKANTHKRASQAASAEAAANAEKAMAKTMRNLAQAIGNGSAKFLDRVRQKTQVSLLLTAVNNAKYDELRAKYASYGDQEKHRGEAPTIETADFAEFPSFTAYRSDLASLARQLVEVDGTKKMGQQLLKVADDVSDAYLKFAKENFSQVASFAKTGGGIAGFSTKGAAEAAIARSGYKGKAIAYQVKRGEHTVIMSPSEAIERGIWKGDGDKRITLSGEFGAELVEKIGKAARRGSKVSVPWQFETALDRRKALERMGIETPAEYRAALREFIGLQEVAEAPSKVKQLERAMVGRRNDGMDFFPTPESVADEMVATAGIEPGMSVLEPSAGWGHIAERIRSSGVEPDVGELSGDRRELLEAKGFNVVGNDFLAMDGQYDRIVMNPPFSDGRDIQHVQHAYTLLKPGGRLVAIMGESAFTNQNKRAAEFRDWLESIGGTDEKLTEGSFNDPSLPVNTGANARMVVIEKQTDKGVAMFSRADIDAATAQSTEQWQSSLRSAATNPQAKDPSMVTPTVLREMGAKANKLVLPRTYLMAIMAKHSDVPANVFESLPSMLADPMFIIPYKDGGLRVFVQAETVRGEPVVVGVSVGKDGRINTVTPFNDDGNKGAGIRRRDLQITQALSRGEKIYAINKEALDKSKASAAAAPGLIPLHRNSISKATVITREDVVKRIEAESNTGGAQYSRGTSSTGLPHTQVSAIVNAIKARWANAPDIVVASNMADTVIPQAVRDEDAKQKSMGATGEPEGFYHGGKVYVVAGEMNTASDVIR